MSDKKNKAFALLKLKLVTRVPFPRNVENAEKCQVCKAKIPRNARDSLGEQSKNIIQFFSLLISSLVS